MTYINEATVRARLEAQEAKTREMNYCEVEGCGERRVTPRSSGFSRCADHPVFQWPGAEETAAPSEPVSASALLADALRAEADGDAAELAALREEFRREEEAEALFAAREQEAEIYLQAVVEDLAGA